MLTTRPFIWYLIRQASLKTDRDINISVSMVPLFCVIFSARGDGGAQQMAPEDGNVIVQNHIFLNNSGHRQAIDMIFFLFDAF